MTRDELIEALSSLEHESWANWQKHLHSKCLDHFEWDNDTVSSDLTGGLVIPAGYVESLERQIATPYAELSEQEKQYDRDEVMKTLPAWIEFVAEWIGDMGLEDNAKGSMAEAWREEMRGVQS